MGLGGDTNGLVLGYYVTEITPKEVRGRGLILVQQFASSFIAIAGSWIAYGMIHFVCCLTLTDRVQALHIYHKTKHTVGRLPILYNLFQG